MNNSANFNSAKAGLNCADTLDNFKNNPVLQATLFSAIKAVPVLGELIDSSMAACITSFQEAKRAELLDAILSDAQITSDAVNDVEFIFNFTKTLEAVNRLSTNDKVKYFANLVKNGYFKGEKISTDEYDECLRLISTLSCREIEYLWFLYQYQRKNLDKKTKYTEYMLNLGVEFGKMFNCDKNAYLDAYDKLCTTGCVRSSYIGCAPSIIKTDHIHPLQEDYEVSNVEIDVDLYYISDAFEHSLDLICGDNDDKMAK